MKFVSIKTRYGGTSSVLCARNIDDATCGLKMRGLITSRIFKQSLKTHTRRTALAFSSSSFLFCFNWFSFLHQRSQQKTDWQVRQRTI
jgi:hypothetical protein